jgi:hypothetical protein
VITTALFVVLTVGDAVWARELAYGSDRVFAIGDGRAGSTEDDGNIYGQMLSRTGVPLTPVTVYATTTVPKRSPSSACVRYGGGKFLVVYGNEYSPTDADIEGVLVLPDGSVQSRFHIDFSTANDQPDGLVYVAERDQFFVVYMRDAATAEIRGAYVSQSGSVSGRGTVIAGQSGLLMGSNSIAYGPGNIVLTYFGADFPRTVYRGHIVPGQTSIREQIFVASGPARPHAAYNSALSRFAVTYDNDLQFGGANAAVFVQTIPVGCFTANCAGTSAVTTVLSPMEAGSIGIAGHGVAAAGNNFVIAAGTRWSDRTGVISASVDGTGFAHTKHLGSWSTTCSTRAPSILDAVSLGADALFNMWGCSNGSKMTQGLTLNTWSGRTTLPFTIAEGF